MNRLFISVSTSEVVRLCLSQDHLRAPASCGDPAASRGNPHSVAATPAVPFPTVDGRHVSCFVLETRDIFLIKTLISLGLAALKALLDGRRMTVPGNASMSGLYELSLIAKHD